MTEDGPFRKLLDRSTYVRYADNFTIASKQTAVVENAFDDAKDYLRDFRHLALNEPYARIRSIASGVSFMGIYFKGKKRFVDRPRIQRFQSSIDELASSKLPDRPMQFARKMAYRVDGFGRLCRESVVRRQAP